jgi:hypothetical protein
VRVLLAWLVLGAAFAGCATPEPEPSDPLDDIIPDLRFDGERAIARTLDVIHDENGEPRYRIPNTTGNDEAARIIHDLLASYGWSASYENFTGAEYRQLDLGPVSGWASSCSSEQYEDVGSYRFHNVVGEKSSLPPGAENGWAHETNLVVLGAHYDSKRAASEDPDPRNHDEPILGADDGAGGVGILLELARVLADVGGLEVRIVLFDGEDGFEDCHPLAGSMWHAQRESWGYGSQQFFLLDMVSNASAQFYREGASDDSAPWLLDEIWSVAARLGVDAFVNETGTTITDDHSSFIAEGVPGIDIINSRPGRAFPPYWHTTDDDADVLDEEMMGNVGRVLEATLRLWAVEPERLDRG